MFLMAFLPGIRQALYGRLVVMLSPSNYAIEGQEMKWRGGAYFLPTLNSLEDAMLEITKEILFSTKGAEVSYPSERHSPSIAAGVVAGLGTPMGWSVSLATYYQVQPHFKEMDYPVEVRLQAVKLFEPNKSTASGFGYVERDLITRELKKFIQNSGGTTESDDVNQFTGTGAQGWLRDQLRVLKQLNEMK
jgi:hypothetical protein